MTVYRVWAVDKFGDRPYMLPDIVPEYSYLYSKGYKIGTSYGFKGIISIGGKVKTNSSWKRLSKEQIKHYIKNGISLD